MDKIRKNDDKVCRVCGDKALGYNFSVITCESCKAFFRRNAVKSKQHKCPFQNLCRIDIVTRRFCQKCRLDKCLAVGMKKEWIMSEEEKQLKNAKINENKSKKKNENNWNISSPDPSCYQSPNNEDSPVYPNLQITKPQARVNAMPQQSPPCTISSTSMDVPSPPKVMRIMDQYMNVDTSSVSASENSLPNVSFHELTKDLDSALQDVPKCNGSADVGLHKSWLKNTVNEVLDFAICAEYSELASKSCLKSFGSSTLTPIEEEKINELMTANAVLQHWSDDKSLFEKGPNTCLIDVINMTDNAIRKLIKMSKKLTAFKNLCQEDQIALLKGSCTELMIMRSVMTYDSEKDGWRVPEFTYIKMDVLKEAKGNVYEEHRRFVQSVNPVWRNDETLMVILSAVVLFTPTRPNLVHHQVIEKEQYSYYFLLQRYLESKNSPCDAKEQFFKMIQMVQDLQKLNENHVRVFLDVNPKDVEPLLIEIFDLCN